MSSSVLSASATITKALVLATCTGSGGKRQTAPGQYSALGWLMDRYYVKTDKASGNVNDPNDWGEEHGNPRYIIDLIKCIVTVSVKTMDIVDNLPDLPTS